ncbi:putative bifunctional diguanylate cyclase/phosphodiesterase [Pengzhenrongella sp.]|uniref:putative bifunctional diguanylate cyclase/phosphodiesterase n=1 Tax=Pengzhenrongella sp. TaxID=2888820 RepID=UPI002F9378D6
MNESVGGLAVAAQCLAAGFVGALCVQHANTWRADRARRVALWLLLWSVALTLLFFLNGILPLIPDGPATEVARFGRAQLLAASVLLALPALRASTGGRPVRWYLATAAALFACRAALWLTTDLVYAHADEAALPRYGPLVGVTFVVALAPVAWYVTSSTRRMPAGLDRFTLRLAWALSIVGLLAGHLFAGSEVSEQLRSVWALPLVVIRQGLAGRTSRAAEMQIRHEDRIRDALHETGRASVTTTDPTALLALAERSARAVLDDNTLTGAITQRPDGRFSTAFHAADPALDTITSDFLVRLGAIVSAATDRNHLAEEVLAAALTDPLTRLPNRKPLEQHLVAALARAAESRARLAVFYCDIDGFKQQNDSRGHAWGDFLLTRTATGLRSLLGKDDFVARFGGDEFVLVVENAGSRDELLARALRVRTGPELEGPDAVAALMSVGVAIWAPGDDIEPEKLLREADTAMFTAKRSHVGVLIFDETLRAQMDSERDLRRELDAALADDEFVLHYQPIVEAVSLDVVGVEALVRWEHAGGLRMPGSWVAFAEETGQIVPIGRRLIVAARAEARRLRLPVAVNVAARQLADPRFLEHLRLDWGDDDWHLLTIEITESSLLEDLAHVIESLMAVRELGARISIDDFGTGYSSFARLATLPVDVLKIDQAFVRDLDGPGGVAVVRAIVALAQAYGLDIVAEGVERIDQLETLVALGVPKVQGYLLGRPSASAPRPVELPGAGPLSALGTGHESGSGFPVQGRRDGRPAPGSIRRAASA